MREKAREAVPWVVTGLVALGIAYHQRFFGLTAAGAAAAPASGPTRNIALAGGGTSDGSHCGTKGYHYYPVRTVTDTGGMLPGTPAGPAVIFGAYGTEMSAASDPGHFTINLLFATGSATRTLDLSAPLRVAVEIEGPNGLVGGAHNLPATLDDPAAKLPDGKIRVNSAGGLSIEVTMPAAALCPGYNVTDVGRKLVSPTDANGTITGQPPHTITASISDPAVAVLRREMHSTTAGPVLAANNHV